jgi:hypothetical protein
MDIDRSKLIKWECLSRYFKEEEVGSTLDALFQNPLCEDSARNEILDKLKLNNEQRDFLFKVYDIDYLYPVDDRPVLVEEKMANIAGKKFQSGNYVYLHHGTSTQYKHLKDASSLGLEAGILLRCVKFKQAPKGLLGYALVDYKDIAHEESRFYPISCCEYLPQANQTKIRVDDFIRRMRSLLTK